MSRSLSIILLVLMSFPINIYSQDLIKSRKTSYYTYIFQLTDSEMKQVVKRESLRKFDASWLHTLVDSFPTDSIYNRRLPPGNYLKVYPDRERLKLAVLTVHDFYPVLVRNNRDLIVRIVDNNGKSLPDAVLRIKGKRIPYDDKTGSYRLPKSGKRGVLEITHNGQKALFHINNNTRLPRCREAMHLAANRAPFQYVWRPVRLAVMIPFDVISSIYHIQPMGSLRYPVTWYHHSACALGSEGSCDRIRHRFTRKYAGYFVLNKPMYLPGDTIFYKAFIVKKRSGKPVNSDVQLHLSSFGKSIDLGEITPYRKGACHGYFVLDDSLGLIIDRNYHLHIRNGRKMNYLSCSFRLEDYFLTGLKLDVDIRGGIQYRGTPYSAQLIARDENNLFVQDGRYEVKLLTKSISNYMSDPVFVPDTIAQFNLPALPDRPTILELPDSLFPPVNIVYDLDVTLLTSDNRKISSKPSVTCYFKRTDITMSLINDSVQFALEENGIRSEAEGVVYGRRGEEKFRAIWQGALPTEMRIDPSISHYFVEAKSETKTFPLRYSQSSLVSCVIIQRGDSQYVEITNPRRLPLVWFIYHRNREIARGEGDEATVVLSYHRKPELSASVNSMWAGEMVSIDAYAMSKRGLEVEVTQPELIYPGQKATFEFLVTDHKGKPVPDADITSFGYTSKFEQTPQLPPLFQKPYSYRLFLNNFRLNDVSGSEASRRLEYQEWKNLAGLDSIEWYRFRYPEDTLYRYSYPMPDSVTQIAPFVFNDGIPEPVHVVYINKEPVFFRWSTNRRPYSFRVSEGYHKVELRLTEHVITIDSVWVYNGEKLILSLDINGSAPGVVIRKASDKLTPAEKRVLYSYILPYRNTFRGQMPYLRQGDQTTELSQDGYRHYGTDLAGPVRPGGAMFVLPDNFSMHFYLERNFRYHFSPQILRMECFKQEDVYPDKLISHRMREFGDITDRAITEKAVLDRWEKDKEKKLINAESLILTGKVSASKGQLVVKFIPDENLRNGMPLLNLLYNTDMNSWVGIYGGIRSHFHNLEPGNYLFYGVQRNGNYIRSDTLVVKPGGINYYPLHDYGYYSDDSLTSRFEALVQLYKNRGASNHYEIINLLHGRTAVMESSEELSASMRTIEGFVRDGYGVPMTFVNVMAKDYKIGVVTDMYGYFRINLPEGARNLVFSFPGYVTAEQDVPSGWSTVVAYLYPLHSMIRSAAMVSSDFDHRSVFYDDPPVMRGTVLSAEVQMMPAYSVRSKSSSGRFRYFPESHALEEEGYTGDFKFDYLWDDVQTDSLPGIAENALFAGFDMASASSIRSNFSDYAYWQPALTTGRNGRASFTVTMPDDVTSWKVYHMVMGGKRQSGYADGMIRSFKPIMAQLNVPRFLTEGDTARVTGTLANHTGDSTELTRSFEVADVQLFSATSAVKHSLVDTFLLTASGSDTLRVLYRIDRQDGYFDGERRDIPIVRQGMEEITATFNLISKDSVLTLRFDTLKGDVGLMIMAGLPAMLAEEVERLISFRYDCNEQLASKLIGHLIKQEMGVAGLERIRNERQINRIIKALNEGRNSDGLWGWWKGNSTSWWITEHVIYALKKAEKAGFRVGLSESGTDASLLMKMGMPVNDRDALAMVRSFRTMHPGMQNETVDQLLSSGLHEGTLNRLRRFEAENLAGRGIPIDSVLKHMRETFYGEIWFGRDTIRGIVSRDELQATLTAYRLLVSRPDVNPEELARIRAWLIRYRSLNYMNTFEHSLWLDALASGITPASTTETKPWVSVSLSSEDHTTFIPEFPWSANIPATETVKVRSESDQMIYVSAVQRNWISDPEPLSNGLSVETRFEENTTTLKAGKEIRLLVDVVAEKDAEYVMIEVPIPASCIYGQQRVTHRAESYREQYKESTTIFCENLRQGKHTFTITLLPRFTGSYILNPARAELMYAPIFNGNNSVKAVMVE